MDPAKAQQAYDEIDKDVEIKSHLDFIYDNLLADETIKELKNDRVKKLAYGETLYSEDEKKTSIKWGKEFRAFIRKKQKDLRDDPDRIKDPDKQKREQPRIKTSIEMLEKAEMFHHKGKCGLVGRVYGELAPKLEKELKFEENFRADTAKMQDKSRFMDSAARTIRMLQEMDGSKYLPSESMDTFYTIRKEQSKSAMNDVRGYS